MFERPEEPDASNSRRWRLIISGIFAVGISLLALTVFSQIFPFSAQPESIPVPLDSDLAADYGADPRTFRIPAFRPEIITDIARDTKTEIPSRHATLLANILTPEDNPPLLTPTPSPAPPRPTRVPTEEPPAPPQPSATNTPANTELPPEPTTTVPTLTPTLTSTIQVEKPTDAVPTIEITVEPTFFPSLTATIEAATPTPLPPKPTLLPTMNTSPTSTP
jgi:hypothetical protein